MREIKFRAWDKVSKVMIDRYEYLLSLSGFNTALLESVNKEGKYDEYLEDSPTEVFELMQFTGLLDKNGKEIYDFDIVRWDFRSSSPFNSLVEISPLKGTTANGHNYPLEEWENNCEVIGNAYENKELIK